ncbi:polyphosphate:AMP phosphotransferase [uncultured Thomasclavelia sp.]|uniref:polyphosphate:AMP phosphotransferase n=1 Tax=uncultured Thomasclavelia sp. TaxID=3025759 RepID=UPI0025EB3317|nr:polyphosphate:AMP phosphotransferase [uncultured Thomasclavelia sp.]
MLKDYKFEEIEIVPDIEECLENAKLELSKKQMLLKEKKLPVVVLFEGWGASGIGTTLGKVIQNMDPRFYTVETMNKITEEETRKPFLYRYFLRIPENGMATFYDHGWMNDVVKAYIHGQIDQSDYEKRIVSIQRFERTLVDNGYLVIKFFFHISKNEQAKRMKKLLKHKNTNWRVSDEDLWQNDHYDKYLDVFNDYMTKTNPTYAPWYVIDATNKKLVQLQVLETLMSCIKTALEYEKTDAPIIENIFPLRETINLNEYDLSVSISEETYRKELKKCRKKLRKLHNTIYRKKIPVIIGYEGWDAAGKGGNIKRVTSGLDPRGYTVYPIAAPEKSEKNRHFLWRFYKRLPKDGHFAIYDRTWYGRVMVERLEGLCSENDWQRAYNEMNEFEKELYDWGAIVIKFWVQIDNQTQLKRFTERQNTPEKRWKITDEDWRNREKWDLYETAITEMLQKTNTEFAPWYVLESVDKKYARIKAMKILIAEIEKRIKED